MGCGCSKKKASVVLPSGSPVLSAEDAARVMASGAAVKYDVYTEGGALVASYTNPVTARSEARRIGGTSVPRGSVTTGNTLINDNEKEPSHG
jgi:hypothetical protein